MPCIVVESPRSGGSSTRHAPQMKACLEPAKSYASREFIHRPRRRAETPERRNGRTLDPFAPARCKTCTPPLVRPSSFTLPRCPHAHINAAFAAAIDLKGLMPAMAGDWPRDPRAYGSPQHTEPPAPVRTLPSVAELLSTRPSANSTIPAYHHRPEYSYARSTPPSASLPPTTASCAASSYWNAVNQRQTSPPVR